MEEVREECAPVLGFLEEPHATKREGGGRMLTFGVTRSRGSFGELGIGVPPKRPPIT